MGPYRQWGRGATLGPRRPLGSLTPLGALVRGQTVIDRLPRFGSRWTLGTWPPSPLLASAPPFPLSRENTGTIGRAAVPPAPRWLCSASAGPGPSPGWQLSSPSPLAALRSCRPAPEPPSSRSRSSSSLRSSWSRESLASTSSSASRASPGRPRELAFVMALVAVGGALDGPRAGRRRRRSPLAVQGYPPAEGRLQRGAWPCSRSAPPSRVLQLLPAGRRSPSRPAGSAYLWPSSSANLVGALADRRRHHRHRRVSRPAAVARAARPGRRRRPGRRCPSGSWRCCCSSAHPVGLAAHPPLLVGRRPAVPPLRQGHPRGQQRRAGLRLRPPGGAGAAGRGRHPADRRRRSGSCSTPSAWRSGCRPTSTRSRAWSSPPRTARSGTTAPATRTTSSAAGRSARPTGPLLVSLARADDEEIGRPGPARGLRPARARRS